MMLDRFSGSGMLDLDERPNGPDLKWVRLKRAIAFLIDFVLYGLIAASLSIALTLAMENLVSLFLDPSEGNGVNGLGAHTADSLYDLTRYVSGLAALAVAGIYVARTLGGPAQSTWGMRLLGLRLHRLDDRPITPRYALAHGLLFIGLTATFAPFLLAPLFLSRKQTLHDRLLDTVAINK